VRRPVRRLALAAPSEGAVGWIGDTLELFEQGVALDLQPLRVERLREWIGGQAKQAKSLARYKIPKLTELLLRDRILEQTQRWYRPALVVMDGSPLLNMTAWAVLYREEYFDEHFCARAVAEMSSRDAGLEGGEDLAKLFPELKTLRRLRLNRLTMPDLVVFLDVAPDVALARIASRGEQRQVHETAEKLGKLRDAYRMVCRVVEARFGVPTVVLDGERPLDEVVAEATRFVSESARGLS